MIALDVSHLGCGLHSSSLPPEGDRASSWRLEQVVMARALADFKARPRPPLTTPRRSPSLASAGRRGRACRPRRSARATFWPER